VTADLRPATHRRSPLGATVDGEHPVATGAGVELVEIPFQVQLNLRGDPADVLLAAVAAHTGVHPPTTPNRWHAAASRDGALAVTWLGPNEWLLTGTGDPTAHAASLADAVRAAGGTVVDVSAHRTVLVVRGPGARDLLASGCSVDLHPRIFDVGHAAQTQLARVDVIIRRAGVDDYHVLVRASFARYLADWLIDALQGA